MSSDSTIPALAEQIKTWFPMFGGRSIAVSDVDAVNSKENMPALPLAVAGLQRIVMQQNERGNGAPIVTEDIILQFWLKPERYKRKNGQETPFWSYYDYDTILNALVGRLLNWTTPQDSKIGFKSMDIEVDPFAVILTFTLRHTYHWCAPDDVEADVWPAALAGDSQIDFEWAPAERPTGQPCTCVPSVPQCPTCNERTYP